MEEGVGVDAPGSREVGVGAEDSSSSSFESNPLMTSTTLNELTSSRIMSTVRSRRCSTLCVSSSAVLPLSLARIPHQMLLPISFLNTSLFGFSPPILVFSDLRTSPERTEESIVCHSSRSRPSGFEARSATVEGERAPER